MAPDHMQHERILAALGDPTRTRILQRLRDGGMAVGDIARGLPVSRPAVSQHLKVLKNAGLVREERVGTRRIYSIQVSGIVELRRYLDRMWEDVMLAFARSAEGSARGNPRKPRRGPPREERR